MNQTQQDLQAAVDSLHEAVVNEARGMITTLSQRAGIGDHGAKFVEYGCQLRRLLPVYAQPGWLIECCEKFGPAFTNNADETSKLSNFVVPNMPKIEQPIFVGEAATLDLDSLFDAQRDRFQVPELFDALISRLEEIIAADVIEHRTVQEAIQRLKAVLARNRRGSLASTVLTMNYGRFVMNAFHGVLSANKYTKPILESLTQDSKLRARRWTGQRRRRKGKQLDASPIRNAWRCLSRNNLRQEPRSQDTCQSQVQLLIVIELGKAVTPQQAAATTDGLSSDAAPVNGCMIASLGRQLCNES